MIGTMNNTKNPPRPPKHPLAVILLALTFNATALQPLRAAPRESEQPEKRMNVVILYADDLGYGDVGFNNAKSKIPTPNFDQLAASGMRFTDGHSSSGICTPSRYALLTGRYHWRDFHSIVGPMGPSVFKDEHLTMPEMMQQQGYSTACIGKWHLGWDWSAIRHADAKPKKVGRNPEWFANQFDWSKSVPDGPLSHGFDHYFGDTVINFPPYCWIEDNRVVTAPDIQMDSRLWPKIKEGNWECRPGPMASGWNPYENLPTLGDRAVRYIEEQSSADKPFFLYFAFPSPHAPIIPNDQFDGMSQAGAYGDFVYETDHVAGRILSAIDEAGIAEDTIVIFTADNGPERYAYDRFLNHEHWSAEPFRGLKRDVYEGGHHVPMVVRWPGVTTAGATNKNIVSQVDIMATLADYTGFQLPEHAAWDSHSLMETLSSTTRQVRESVIHNTFADRWGIRQGKWLLISGPDGYHSRPNAKVESLRGYPDKAEDASQDKSTDSTERFELYNLEADLGQRNNIASEHAEIVAKLAAALEHARKHPTAPRLN